MSETGISVVNVVNVSFVRLPVYEQYSIDIKDETHHQIPEIVDSPTQVSMTNGEEEDTAPNPALPKRTGCFCI